MHVRVCRLLGKSMRVNCVRNIHACYMRGTLESCIFHATGKRGPRQLSYHHACKCKVIVEWYCKYTTWCVKWSLIKRCRYHECILHVIHSSWVPNFTSSSDHALAYNSQKALTNLFSARIQLASSKTNLFIPCVQLASDPINLSSNCRVTHVF